jgi:HEPN domain-containing protein/predicted nucleotidyltransferase
MTAQPKRPTAVETEREAPIAEMTRRIVERVNPLQVILFGSRARGDQRRGSDVDLLVIVPDDQDRDKAWRKVNDAVRKVRVPNDVLVTMPREISRYGNLIGLVYRPALRQGTVLYDAASGYAVWSSDSETPRPPALQGGIVTDEVRIAETRRWLGQARQELMIAEAHVQGDEAAAGIVCYLAQQSAEKALKAVLIFLQTEFEKTHNLEELRKLIPAGWHVKDEHRRLTWLSEWVVKGRYPGEWAQATEADARRATRQAREVFESVVRDIQQHGVEPEQQV